jgi:hypothetical protein
MKGNDTAIRLSRERFFCRPLPDHSKGKSHLQGKGAVKGARLLGKPAYAPEVSSRLGRDTFHTTCEGGGAGRAAVACRERTGYAGGRYPLADQQRFHHGFFIGRFFLLQERSSSLPSVGTTSGHGGLPQPSPAAVGLNLRYPLPFRKLFPGGLFPGAPEKNCPGYDVLAAPGPKSPCPVPSRAIGCQDHFL